MARRSRGSASPAVLLINTREGDECRVALLEGGKLEEYYLERESLGSTLGNIYKARVSNVEKSFGAAFVEFGHQRQGFLHVSDLCMSAVGEEARGLLEPLQAARETANEDDVVPPAGGDVPGAGSEPTGDGPDPTAAEEPQASEPGPVDEAGPDAGPGEGALDLDPVGDELPFDPDEVGEAGGNGSGRQADPATAGATAAVAAPARGRGGRRRGRGKRPSRELPPIEQILHKGQEVVVQVIKDGIGSKGPTLTTFLSLPGRFVVLMPGISKRGVSRKVTDVAERERLKAIVRGLDVPEGLGFIVRTAGSGHSAEELECDLAYLLRVWERMRVRVREHSAPVLLNQENDLVIRTLRDMYDGKGEIILDHPATAAKAKEFLSQLMPECVDRIQEYTGERPLFHHHGIEKEVAGLLASRIELKSGVCLVLEQTEALVAIDVNSGRYKAQKDATIEDNAFAVNCEAAVEIARQVRLRDLGGLVVVDFIDMRAEKHRKRLEQIFKEALSRDRARKKVARTSPFGIIELTRQRVRPSLKRTVHQPCPYCTGTGFIPTDETSCLMVIRSIREHLRDAGAALMVTVRPEVAEAVQNRLRQVLLQMEKESGKGIFVRSDHRLSYEEVEIRPMVTLPEDMDHRRR